MSVPVSEMVRSEEIFPDSDSDSSVPRGRVLTKTLLLSVFCFYRAAELLNALPMEAREAAGDGQPYLPSVILTPNQDPHEARLEAGELSRYMLAKSFFDCREFDRCAAVFLPDTLLSGLPGGSGSIGSRADDSASAGVTPFGPGRGGGGGGSGVSTPRGGTSAGKGKGVAGPNTPHGRPTTPTPTSKRGGSARAQRLSQQQQQSQQQPQQQERPGAGAKLPELSQKSLFLCLYARLLAGEKRMDEDVEMVMGPNDLGSRVNKQLTAISRVLEAWFRDHLSEDGTVAGSQGWLEYLYVCPTRADFLCLMDDAKDRPRCLWG